MAYTEAQWNKLQASLPAEERMSYLDYLKETDPAGYSRAVSSILENLKTAETQSGTSITKIVDEGSKLAGAKTDTAAQKAAQLAATKVTSNFRASEAASAKTDSAASVSISAAESAAQKRAEEQAAAIADEYYTKQVGTTGKTQAQLDALANAQATATLIGGTVNAEGKVVAPTVVTTAGPGVVTTAGPNVVTTAGPGVVTTAGPSLTTISPVLTTAGPSLTTISPVLTTAGPSLTTKGPTLTTQPPAGRTYTATDGTVFTDQLAYVQYQKMLTDGKLAKDALSAAGAAERQSAYDLLYAQFSAYGLGSLVEPLRGLIQSGASPAEFTIKLRESDAYKKRFSANPQRISKGLKAISEAEYLGLEDQYQNILRNAGLPESYWKRGDLGVQEGFTNFIANDVSAVELEDRVSTAQQRVLFANPEVSIALKTFYPDISNGDLLAYALDPTKGLEQIKRRITAAEIGSSAVQLGLATNVTDAEYLARYGVNKAQAQQGYGTIAGGLQRGSQLASIYGENPYTQTTAEREVFNVPGAQESRAQRQKLTGLEKATFGGQTGLTSGALARDRAGAF
jgi:hypothetical protein